VALYSVPSLIEGAGLLIGTGALIGLFGHALAPLVGLRVAIEVAVTVLLVVAVRRWIGFRFEPSAALLRRQLGYGLRNYASSLLWLFLLQSDLVLSNYFL